MFSTQEYCREPPSWLPELCFCQSFVETQHSSWRFGTGGLQLLHTLGFIFNSMWKVLKMPCTWYSSRTRASTTLCQLQTLAATFPPLRWQNWLFDYVPVPVRFLPGNGGSSSLPAASMLLRFWRCSIPNLRTPGSPSTSCSLFRPFGCFTATSSTNVSAIDPRQLFRILWDTMTNADTELIAPWPSQVGQYMPCIVWKDI